jgi:transitional endoplasmic reticulum ATPase
MDDKLFQKALETLRSTLKFAPQNAELRLQIASLLESAGRYEEARTEIELVLQFEPTNSAALIALGVLLRESGKNEESAARLSEAIRYDDKNADAHLELCKTLIQLNRRDKAQKSYQIAVDLDPTLLDSEIEKELFPKQLEKPQIAHTFGPESYDDEEEFVDPLRALGLELEKPSLNFDGVGGMIALKEEISLGIIYPFQQPELYAAYGKKVGGGILLYGPPGCGKTFIARATAGECGARFIAVGIEDVLDMWHGQSERKLHLIFEAARANTPTVIFFDELDALAGKRSDMSHSPHARTIVNQFLSELDGVKGENKNVLVMGATNSPWQIDPAFRRPGRFDKIVFVPPPDTLARVEVLKIHAQNKPIEGVNFEKIAARMKRFSGADIAAVVDMAAETALRESLKTKRIRPIGEKDFLTALKSVKPTTEEWFATAKNYALYANQAGAYDAIQEYLQKRED